MALVKKVRSVVMDEYDFDYREYCVPYVFSAWCDSRNIQRTQRRVPGGSFMIYFFGLRGPDKENKRKVTEECFTNNSFC